MEPLDVDSATAGEIMTPFVIMLESNSPFNKIIHTLTDKGITAVFIHDALENEYYILSQTDIIQYFANGGLKHENIGQIPARKIMKGPIQALDINTTVDQIIRFMTRENYKRVLITDDGKPTGVVSTRDIMKWNNTYFKPAKPQILLIMDNISGNFIAKHIFEENVEKSIQRNLIDLYGGALQSISFITDEIMKQSGLMTHLEKDNRSVLFEPHKEITGILICDYNSIHLRRKLIQITDIFYNSYKKFIQKCAQDKGVCRMLDIKPFLKLFYT